MQHARVRWAGVGATSDETIRPKLRSPPSEPKPAQQDVR
jgi:hypothetical protein